MEIQKIKEFGGYQQSTTDNERKVLLALYVEFAKDDLNMRNIFNPDLLDMEHKEIFAALELLVEKGLASAKIEELRKLASVEGFAFEKFIPAGIEKNEDTMNYVLFASPASLMISNKGSEYINHVLGISDERIVHEKWVKLLDKTKELAYYDIHLNVLAYVATRFTK